MANHFERYAQVAEILVRHGFGQAVDSLGLRLLHPRDAPHQAGGMAAPDRLAAALAELGPAFIKLGQMLSTRPDILPARYIASLSGLQDGAPVVATETIRAIIEQELGAPPETLFRDFSDTPLASASIGQAHAAVLLGGMSVVVKVRRPGVVEQVLEDLEIMQNLAHRAGRQWASLADFNIEGVAASFAATLRAELDYLSEARNAERFARNFAHDPTIHIPNIFWDTTTSRVLTMERIHGLRVDDPLVAALPAGEKDRLAGVAARATAKMVFEDGFFHADPHPGNFFIEDTGSIGLIDFGMVGVVDDALRDRLGRLLLAFSRGDPGLICRALLEISDNAPTPDRVRFRQDVAHFVGLYQGRTLAEIRIAPLISEMLALLHHHRIQLPGEMALVAKTVIMTEGMGAALDPGFNLGEVVKPFAERMAWDRFSPDKLPGLLRQLGLDAAGIGAALPGRLEHLLQQLDDGVDLRLRPGELEPLVKRAERIGNRLVAGMVLTAFIRGIGDLANTEGGPVQGWRKGLLAGGLGALGAASGYLAWTARPGLRRRGQ